MPASQPIFISGSSQIPEPTAHGFSKCVLVRSGTVPDITQVALAELPPGAEIERHFHPTMYEFFFSLEGSARFFFEEGSHMLKPGDAIIVPPGVQHEIKAGEQGFRVFYFGVAADQER